MTERTIRRVAGWFGIAGFLVFLLALPLYFIGAGKLAPLENTVQFSAYLSSTRSNVLTRAALADPLIMIGLVVFLVGFSQLIRRARREYKWIASLVLGAGLVVIVLELVGDGLEAGAALDTMVAADPSIVRGLMEASFPFYGSIGLVMSALLLGASGVAILRTSVLPQWTGWFGLAAAAANLAVAPSILGGNSLTGFYTAPGYAPSIGQAAMILWFLVASITMLTTTPVTKSSG